MLLPRSLLDILFPPLCHACRSFIPLAGEILICPECLEKTSFLVGPLCTICGTPFTTEKGRGHLCGDCLGRLPLHRSRSAVVFAGPVRDLIHGFKYGNRVHLADPLAILMAGALASFREEARPELILPVPLHRKRLRERGFNQAQLLAKVLEKRWRVPVETGNLRRIRWTDPQTTLDAEARWLNVSGAFEVKNGKRLAGKRVMLVDDVLTTGSTMRECAEVLLDAGVAEVVAVTVARGGVQ
ncbi:ComF family protein [Geomonas sp. Red32]|uniref:ComF family protein n=1 Tax=Geomonas sp. Red32 TaxID=2912856 RepID=UPI00202CAAA8|nr:ComF family protein [Geomonas sp. Red32]MCM0081151.1 ComF family protein [Geomonas sp. Red32]